MSLSDDQRVRYARHLLLPELGEAGQLKLLAGSVRFAEGVAQGAREVAGEYLRRAGVRVSDVSVSVSDHDYAHAHDHAHDDEVLLDTSVPDCAPELLHAAQGVAGAFAAVEAIKQLAGIGKPGALDLNLLRAEEV